MGQIEKTVFMSYRRSNISWALAVFQDLTQSGFDVFFDYEGIASGDFEQVILVNIHARAHFIVLLTPPALNRCSEAGDWFRREIETAISLKRNIVPLLIEGFSFTSPESANQLTGSLATFSRYNGLRIHAEYFKEGMHHLRERFLDVPLDAVLHPVSEYAEHAARQQQTAAIAAPSVPERELSARELFNEGMNAARRGDDSGALGWYREAAEAGNGAAMTQLGLMYENGRGGLPKDVVQAKEWFIKAANAGDSAGMHQMGLGYFSGRTGVPNPEDQVKALNWHLKAAEAGYPPSMTTMGTLYQCAIVFSGGFAGLPQDAAEAVNWWIKAADAADPEGMRHLATAYSNGWGGMPKDGSQAVNLYRRAAVAGDVPSMVEMGLMYEKGLCNLPKHEVQAADWYRKAAAAGNTQAKEFLERLALPWYVRALRDFTG
jgi:TPR repeat protein